MIEDIFTAFDSLTIEVSKFHWSAELAEHVYLTITKYNNKGS